MKKVTCIILVITVVIMLFAPSYAFAADGNVLITNTAIAPLNELSISDAFFKAIDDYTLSSVTYSNGITETSIKSQNPLIIYTIFEKGKKNIQEIREELLTVQSNPRITLTSNRTVAIQNSASVPDKPNTDNITVLVTELSKQEEVVPFYTPPGDIGTPYQRLVSEANSKFGAPYSNKFLASKTQSGVTARLYGFHEFAFIKKSISGVLINLVITVVSVMLGWPLQGIIIAFAIYTTVDGIKAIKNAVKAHEYNVEVYWDKDVIINGYRAYWAGKTEYWDALIGDIGVAFTHKRTNQHTDLDDNDYLLQRSIENYLLW